MKLGSKQKQQSLILLRVGIGVVLILCLLVLSSVYRRYEIEREMANRRAVLEAEQAALIERRDVLEEKVEYLADPSNVEAEIRRSFDVAKEGEQVVVILDDETEDVVTETVVPDELVPWYKFWQ